MMLENQGRLRLGDRSRVSCGSSGRTLIPPCSEIPTPTSRFGPPPKEIHR